MNALEKEIRRLIEADGPMPVSRYMTLCLTHPEHGYYMNRDPFGERGDFVTAPEVSQMFGELIGLWFSEVWRLMGRPGKLNLVELGPGRGTLMRDFLRAAKVVPEFRAALEVHLIETSPTLTEIQHVVLQSAGVPLHWHKSPATLPRGPLAVVANEFLDALPSDQLIKPQDGWREWCVGVADGKLAFGASPHSLPGVEKVLPTSAVAADTGAIFERRDLSAIKDITTRIARDGGAALFIDYGHERSAPGDTLQAIKAHRFVNALENPGEADLTSHVDFEALGSFARLHGARVHGPKTQGALLRLLGIEARAEKLKEAKEPGEAEEIDAALSRLTGPAPGMGELFKALAFSHPALKSLPAFD